MKVVVAGAGVAGLETVMALRHLAGTRVEITLVAPNADFVYRPLAVEEAFDIGAPHLYAVKRIAEDFDLEFVRDTVDEVDVGGQHVRTGGGAELRYDALVLATGARPAPVWDYVITFTGSRSADSMRAVVADVERGVVDSVAFVVPTGPTWPLPLYELALLTARRATAAGVDAELAIYTPEKEPLAVFGRDASRSVADELERAGVLVARSAVAGVSAHGDVIIPFEEWPQRFDRVVAVPRLLGSAPEGIPQDKHGFVPIDRHGAVRDATHVFAAGDGSDYPVKHGGIAAQQADAVAEVIAAQAGAGIEPRPFSAILRGKLVTGAAPRYLRTDLGSSATDVSETATAPLWWPGAKIAGVHLAPYLTALEPAGAVFAGGAPAARPVTLDQQRIVFLPGEFENDPRGE
jgi:sulfide:quinone oxidoreductase